jgi:hypothetical protein
LAGRRVHAAGEAYEIFEALLCQIGLVDEGRVVVADAAAYRVETSVGGIDGVVALFDVDNVPPRSANYPIGGGTAVYVVVAGPAEDPVLAEAEEERVGVISVFRASSSLIPWFRFCWSTSVGLTRTALMAQRIESFVTSTML